MDGVLAAASQEELDSAEEDAPESVRHAQDRARYLYWGEASHEEESLLTIVKSAVLLDRVWRDGEKIEVRVDHMDRVLLKAISTINNEAYKKIVHVCDTKLRKRATKATLDGWQTQIYCEDPALSQDKQYGHYRSIQVPQDIPTIADADRQYLLDMILGHLNIDHAKGNSWDRTGKTSGGTRRKKNATDKAWDKAKERQDEWRAMHMVEYTFPSRDNGDEDNSAAASGAANDPDDQAPKKARKKRKKGGRK